MGPEKRRPPRVSLSRKNMGLLSDILIEFGSLAMSGTEMGLSKVS